MNGWRTSAGRSPVDVGRSPELNRLMRAWTTVPILPARSHSPICR